MDLSLVLDQENIAHELRGLGDEQWSLTIADADAERAERALSALERENPPPVRKPRPPAPAGEGVAAGVILFLALLALHVWTGPESDNAWFVRGSADASQILRGEWWRLFTALTL